MQESPGVDTTAEAAGSGRGRHRLTLAVARHGRVRQLIRVRVFSIYGDRHSMRFAPMRSQQQGECAYANLNQRRAAMKPSNGEAAQSVLDDGEGGLR
jgi:hypothetical protein